jgi:hypothetical protein
LAADTLGSIKRGTGKGRGHHGIHSPESHGIGRQHGLDPFGLGELTDNEPGIDRLRLGCEYPALEAGAADAEVFQRMMDALEALEREQMAKATGPDATTPAYGTQA